MNTKNFMSGEQLLAHWQGHRHVTRRTIEAFPEQELYQFSIGGMRPFSEMVIELLNIGGQALKMMVENSTDKNGGEKIQATTKLEILAAWDEQTDVINSYFVSLSEERFQETFNLYGEYNFPIYQNILYFIDNEIHHRAQGFVYLRALGIAPPFFWEL